MFFACPKPCLVTISVRNVTHVPAVLTEIRAVFTEDRDVRASNQRADNVVCIQSVLLSRVTLDRFASGKKGKYHGKYFTVCANNYAND